MAAAPSLFDAAKTANVNIVRKWLDTEGDVNRKDDHDFTVLHWAARHSHVELVQMVVDHGADVNAVNCVHDTPLHLAAGEGSLAIVTKLVEAGANPMSVNDHGNTPLHYACFWRRDDVALYLLDKGALVAAANKYGKTPLNRAGDRLGAVLKDKAVAMGQTLQSKQMQVRNAEEAAGLAKAKFMAQAGASFEINNSTLKYEEQLAPASRIAEVFRGEWATHTVAIKRAIAQDKITQATAAEFLKEADLLRKLFHVNLLPVLAVVTKPPDVAIVTQLQPLGSLSQLLHDASFNMDQRQAIKFALEGARAIAYLHDQNMAHYNVRSSNMLITDDLSVKVTDYGFRELFNTSLRQEIVYEPQWIAPEALRTKDTEIADFKPCDVYGFGMVLFEIITRQLPFEGMNPMQIGMRVCLESIRPTIPDFVPRHLSQLLTLCWQEEPARRPRMDQIVAILEKL